MEFENKCFVAGVGAQRCGTTWLASYFFRHRDVFIPPTKELHYFDTIYRRDLCAIFEKNTAENIRAGMSALLSEDDSPGRGADCGLLARQLLDEFDRFAMYLDKRRYLEFFRLRVGAEKVFCDITPSYSLLPREGFEAIYALHPTTRFIFLMRDPVHRFWSQFLSREKLHPEIDPGTDLGACLDDPDFVERTRYDKTIAALENAVAREDILYVFYEDLFCDDAIARICRFCGIEFAKPAVNRRINASRGSKATDEIMARIYGRFNEVYRFCADRFGPELPQSWRATMDRFAGS